MKRPRETDAPDDNAAGQEAAATDQPTPLDIYALPDKVVSNLKKKNLLPAAWVQEMNPLRGKKIEILLKEARHHLGALAAMHIMACKLSAGDITLMGGKTYFLDAGRIPTEQPTLELPLLKKTSQILIGTAAPKGGFTLRWALSSELLTSFGWPSDIIKLSYFSEHRRSQVLAAAPAGHTHDSCGVSSFGSWVRARCDYACWLC